MKPAERLERYRKWLDEAEDLIVEWLSRIAPGSPDEPIDVRLLNTAVYTLRRIIDIRRILDIRDAHENKPARPALVITDEKALEFLRECEARGTGIDDEDEMP